MTETSDGFERPAGRGHADLPQAGVSELASVSRLARVSRLALTVAVVVLPGRSGLRAGRPWPRPPRCGGGQGSSCWYCWSPPSCCAPMPAATPGWCRCRRWSWPWCGRSRRPPAHRSRAGGWWPCARSPSGRRWRWRPRRCASGCEERLWACPPCGERRRGGDGAEPGRSGPGRRARTGRAESVSGPLPAGAPVHVLGVRGVRLEVWSEAGSVPDGSVFRYRRRISHDRSHRRHRRDRRGAAAPSPRQASGSCGNTSGWCCSGWVVRPAPAAPAWW